MENKLNKEYLLKLYETYDEDNMFYALTMLKTLGLTEWFKKNFEVSEHLDLDFFCDNTKFIDMFDLSKFDRYDIHTFILSIDNGISYFNQKQLDKLYENQISTIIKIKPELEKYLINCKNYEKQIR